MLRPTPIRNIASVLGFVLALVAWVLFAPSALGGSASFAVIHGTSMQPLLERGDLAVVRPAPEYQAGDIVAYRSSQLGRTVLHRIIGRDGQRFVLKGDANDFVDPDRPLKSDVVGKLWFDVPVLGSVVDWLRSPLNLGVLAAVIAVLALGLGAGRHARRRGRSGGRGNPAGSAAASSARNGLALPVLAVALIISLALGAVAFARSETRTVPHPGLFNHEGRFGYTATVPVGSVYASSRLETGDPIFPRLVRSVEFSFDYTFASKAPASVAGSGKLVAELSDGVGWRWPVTLEAERSFTGRRLTMEGILGVAALQTEIERFEKATDVVADSYLVTIKPEVEVRADVAGQRFEEIYAPPLTFRLDSSRLMLETPGPNEDQRSNGFIRSQSGTGERIVVRTLSLGPISAQIGTARKIAVVLGLISLVGLGVLGLAWRRALRGDEPKRIQARYGAWLVTVEPHSRSGQEPVRVAAMEGLVQLAERYDRMILHERAGDLHRYVVEEDGELYLYETRSSAPEAATRPLRPVLRALPFVKSLR